MSYTMIHLLQKNIKQKNHCMLQSVPPNFQGSHFEGGFVTPFGGVWEKLAKVAGTTGLGKCE